MTSHQRRLRFLTFTVLGPANPGWDRRRVVLGSALRRLDADVVALQEVRAEDVEELLVMGGTPAQVENAAEIGIEHNLGMTRDPIGGLVQVPCIERNAMGSIKAINAARLALHGDGEHFVSLDAVLRTMADTGRDLHEKYKETSTGGLAVNVTEC